MIKPKSRTDEELDRYLIRVHAKTRLLRKLFYCMSSVQPDEFGFSWIELEPTLAAPLNYVLEACICFESCYGLMEIVKTFEWS